TCRGRDWRKTSGRDAEHGVIRSDPPELGVGRRRAHAVEEDADLELPPLQVRAQDLDLVVVADLFGPEGLGVVADAQLALTGDAQVLHPLRLTPRRDEIPRALEGEQVHGRGAPFAARA